MHCLNIESVHTTTVLLLQLMLLLQNLCFSKLLYVFLLYRKRWGWGENTTRKKNQKSKTKKFCTNPTTGARMGGDQSSQCHGFRFRILWIFCGLMWLPSTEWLNCLWNCGCNQLNAYIFCGFSVDW